ncbi:MAG: hypothetical protein GPJ54_12220 [Candidatus Heimdallarchaeota archaeon]|nr:hypothetical protein [Candidatus Heimdallarchaeota archaeon]
MVSYKIASLIQSIFIIIAGISVFDEGYESEIMNDRLFNDSTEFWNWYGFLAYCFFIVAIFQLFKDRPSL